MKGLTKDEKLILQEAERIKRKLNEYGRRSRYDYDDYYNYGGAARDERRRRYSHPDWGAHDEYPTHHGEADEAVIRSAIEEIGNLGLSTDDIGPEHLEVLGVSRDYIAYDLEGFFRKQDPYWFDGFFARLGVETGG